MCPRLLFTNWALMVHIVVAQVEAPHKKEKTCETTTFLQESGFGGFWVQWAIWALLWCSKGALAFFVVFLLFSFCFGALSCLVVVVYLSCLISCCCC